MTGAKEMFLRMKEADYKNLPPEYRDQFTYIEVRESNEWETHKDDPVYKSLSKAKRKASKDLQDYLYDKRHGRNT